MINPGLTDYGGIVSCNSAIAASFAVFFTKKLLIESRKLREQDLIKYKSSIRPFFLANICGDYITFSNVGNNCLTLNISHHGSKTKILNIKPDQYIRSGDFIELQVVDKIYEKEPIVSSVTLEGENFGITLKIRDIDQNVLLQNFEFLIFNQKITLLSNIPVEMTLG